MFLTNWATNSYIYRIYHYLSISKWACFSNSLSFKLVRNLRLHHLSLRRLEMSFLTTVRSFILQQNTRTSSLRKVRIYLTTALPWPALWKILKTLMLQISSGNSNSSSYSRPFLMPTRIWIRGQKAYCFRLSKRCPLWKRGRRAAVMSWYWTLFLYCLYQRLFVRWWRTPILTLL